MLNVELVLLVAVALVAPLANSTLVRNQASSKPNNQIFRDFEDVSGDGRYLVKWEVNFDTEIIIFDVEVKTTGFVGFGISPQGGMTGADIVIGGVFENGTTYFSVTDCLHRLTKEMLVWLRPDSFRIDMLQGIPSRLSMLRKTGH